MGDAEVPEINPADPDPDSRVWPLGGSTWVLTEIRDAQGAHAVPGGIRSILEVDTDEGHLYVETGCNHGRASVTIDAASLQIGPMALTRMMCPDSVMWVEHSIVAVLQGQVPYLIYRDILAVGGAEKALVYRSDLPPAA